ncbi:hypothetical protein AVEN_106558-1 [Araneus ventricosus]|uniref:Uncharacterized protein n=1 Tax=Araneus ventricosus TaxID=182803 RepID=A0A4Y2T1Z8_ARAVE|nr:hypothetical protein AVEN_106558-1 [Araneus ventricosus]
MDLPKVIAWMTATPWLWIMIKFVICADLSNMIPLIVFGYLLVMMNRAIENENLNVLKTKKDKLQMKTDAFSQTEGQQCEEKCTQTVHETNNTSTQVEKIQFLETSTQAAVIQIDACTQIEQNEFSIKSSETMSKSMQDKDVQTSLRVSENKECQTSSYLLSDKEVQTEIIPKETTKVFVPLKKQKPKPNIPLTKEFLKYHQNKHTLQRRKIKFKPKLEKLSEVDENEPGISKMPLYDELVSPPSSSDKSIFTQNNCKNFVLHEVDEDEKKSDLDMLSSHEELELQVSSSNETIIAPNSLFLPGDSFNYDHPVIVQYEKKCRKKQTKGSFFKKKFTNLKKLFKK